jgi:hypothetical protein
MPERIPRLDKRVLAVAALSDTEQDKKYWLACTAEQRMNAIELNRVMVYGRNRTSARLQRFLEVAELARR